MTHSEPAPTVWRARVTTPAFASSQVLHERVQAVFEEDGYPVTLFEEFDGGPWTVEVLFFDGTPEEARTRLAESLGAEGEGLAVSVEALPERNWVEASLEGLAPVEIGRFAVHGRHDRGKITRPVPIEIDAGLAFGTGHHATTVGCLAAIEARLRRGPVRNPLDLGTGTGVLAIAMTKMQRVPVLATDIDPVAVEVAEENARLNGVAPWIAFRVAAGMDDRRLKAGGFDFVVANILARPLMAIAPKLCRALAPRATVVLSGLRLEDGRRVIATYVGQGLELVHRDPRGRWLTLTFERRPRR